MRTRFAPHIEAWIVVLLIAIGFGFSANWSTPWGLLLCILLGAAVLHVLLTEIAAGMQLRSQQQIRQMTPTELEQYLETLSGKKRQSFVAHLLEVDVKDEQYLGRLTSNQRNEFEAILGKLRLEKDAATR